MKKTFATIDFSLEGILEKNPFHLCHIELKLDLFSPQIGEFLEEIINGLTDRAFFTVPN